MADLIAHAYELNEQATDAAGFTAAACDPASSVVIEACAGSGKTWLLVARMLRLLLAGAEPSELLAITFTRKAAQEMRERLLQILHELALADDAAAEQMLLERGVARGQLASALPAARKLYDKVLANPQGLAMDTFHSWFGRLLQLAPLASGVPHAYSLLEATGELQHEAYRQLMQNLNLPELQETRQALLYLYHEIGDFNTRNMLNVFLDKRAEWWACNLDGDIEGQAPLAWLQEMCGSDLDGDARLSVWKDQDFVARLYKVAQVLGEGSVANQKNAITIESALTAGASIDHFEQLYSGFFTSSGGKRSHNLKTKALIAAVEKHIGPDMLLAFADECEALADELDRWQRRSQEVQVFALNQAIFTVGAAYLDCYQQLKAEQKLFDFADLEWQAWRLLSNEDYAAYLHTRLDARYKHILLDEFQDTNPLQWNIVQAWLQAYGDDATRPTVFIVGDPKQSIYRFRRAEPRVFLAARKILQAQGANILRTNQTRRNAQAIVSELNHSMQANPLYVPQQTASSSHGAVWRLPLIENPESSTEDGAPLQIRNPLTTALEEEEDTRRLDEGRCVVQFLLQQRAERGAQALPWKEVMLLVRRRTHLSAYETALREAGIPYVSPRRGGLLDVLEVIDLMALLNFLVTPGDNRSLAHVLKSPMMLASDEDLMALAVRTESSWWQALQDWIEQDTSAPKHLQRAVNLLQNWMRDAHGLPVHDLLDRVLHQGELAQRYAQTAAASERAQVQGNLQAFIELALNMDAGRYPSLPKFIAALNSMLRIDDDAPDEAAVDSAADAVRILTIHSAKGLEADVVVLLDANHSAPARDNIGILCQLPLEPGQVRHFSVFGRKDQRGAARDALFASEDAQSAQENWNLLYVAATRARQILLVSGIADRHGDMTDGSWYHHLRTVPSYVPEAVELAAQMETRQDFQLAVFAPPCLPPPELPLVAAPSQEQLEGIALHSLLERLTQGATWPVTVPDADVIAHWLPCSSEIAKLIKVQADYIFQKMELEKYFNPALFLYAHNEMEILFEGATLRLDRVVVFADAVWILDYKRALLASEQQAYQQQLANYQLALQSVFIGKPIHAALILSCGDLIELL